VAGRAPQTGWIWRISAVMTPAPPSPAR
jgi:hypothetical protein